MTATGYDFLRISLNDAPIITTFDDIPGLATNRHYVCLPNNPRMKFAIRSTIDGSLRIVCVGNVPKCASPMLPRFGAFPFRDPAAPAMPILAVQTAGLSVR